MTIRTVIFDLGHTLWDIGPQGPLLDDAYSAFRSELCARLRRDDLPPAEAIRHAVADELRADRETYDVSGSHLEQPPTYTWVERALRGLGTTVAEDILQDLTPPLFATEVDTLICAAGTRGAVAALAADGYALGCITNTLADAPTIRRMLSIHGFDGLMRSVVVSSEEGVRKPHGALFQKALLETRARADEAVFVGDSPVHDIGGAKSAGMRAILTTQYVTRSYEGIEPPPDAVIGHVRELRAAITMLDARAD